MLLRRSLPRPRCRAHRQRPEAEVERHALHFVPGRGAAGHRRPYGTSDPGGFPHTPPDGPPAHGTLEPIRRAPPGHRSEGILSWQGQRLGQQSGRQGLPPRATGSSPASAITAWTDVESGQPVMILAAARISRSSSSTWEGDVAGSQAAAACSMAPRT